MTVCRKIYAKRADFPSFRRTSGKPFADCRQFWYEEVRLLNHAIGLSLIAAVTTLIRVRDRRSERLCLTRAIASGLVAFGLSLYSSSTLAQALPVNGEVDALHRRFMTPPDDSRIMMRWWWFGPAVTKPELTRELEQMKAAGIGGVEIANLYPLALDDPSTEIRNTPFLSPEQCGIPHTGST
jgi:hypothetical protein